jgi:hypothetical protein
MADQGVPCAFLTAALDGSTLSTGANPNWEPSQTSGQYFTSKLVVVNSGSKVKAVLWWQGESDVLGTERHPGRAEQVEASEHGVAEAQGHGTDRGKAGAHALGGEARPRRSVTEVAVGDHLARGEAVEAGALVVLDLEQLEQLAAVVRGSRDANAAVRPQQDFDRTGDQRDR